MLLRVRSSAGTWRLQGLDEAASVGDLWRLLETEHGVKSFSNDSEGRQVLALAPGAAGPWLEDDGATLASLGLKHGDLIYLSRIQPDPSLPPLSAAAPAPAAACGEASFVAVANPSDGAGTNKPRLGAAASLLGGDDGQAGRFSPFSATPATALLSPGLAGRGAALSAAAGGGSMSSLASVGGADVAANGGSDYEPLPPGVAEALAAEWGDEAAAGLVEGERVGGSDGGYDGGVRRPDDRYHDRLVGGNDHYPFDGMMPFPEAYGSRGRGPSRPGFHEALAAAFAAAGGFDDVGAGFGGVMRDFGDAAAGFGGAARSFNRRRGMEEDDGGDDETHHDDGEGLGVESGGALSLGEELAALREQGLVTDEDIAAALSAEEKRRREERDRVMATRLIERSVQRRRPPQQASTAALFPAFADVAAVSSLAAMSAAAGSGSGGGDAASESTARAIVDDFGGANASEGGLPGLVPLTGYRWPAAATTMPRGGSASDSAIDVDADGLLRPESLHGISGPSDAAAATPAEPDVANRRRMRRPSGRAAVGQAWPSARDAGEVQRGAARPVGAPPMEASPDGTVRRSAAVRRTARTAGEEWGASALRHDNSFSAAALDDYNGGGDSGDRGDAIFSSASGEMETDADLQRALQRSMVDAAGGSSSSSSSSIGRASRGRSAASSSRAAEEAHIARMRGLRAGLPWAAGTAGAAAARPGSGSSAESASTASRARVIQPIPARASRSLVAQQLTSPPLSADEDIMLALAVGLSLADDSGGGGDSGGSGGGGGGGSGGGIVSEQRRSRRQPSSLSLHQQPEPLPPVWMTKALTTEALSIDGSGSNGGGSGDGGGGTSGLGGGNAGADDGIDGGSEGAVEFRDLGFAGEEERALQEALLASAIAAGGRSRDGASRFGGRYGEADTEDAELAEALRISAEEATLAAAAETAAALAPSGAAAVPTAGGEPVMCRHCGDRPESFRLGCGHRFCGGCACTVMFCPFCNAHVTTRIPD
ncbi:unnamed protein product [Phaeothamnion confervicola]